MNIQNKISTEDAIYQLESLKIHCQIMADENADDPDDTWRYDVAALGAGIAALKCLPYKEYAEGREGKS